MRVGSDPDAPPKKFLRGDLSSGIEDQTIAGGAIVSGAASSTALGVGFGAVTVIEVESHKEELAALRGFDDAPSFIACGQCDGRFSKAKKEIIRVGKGKWYCKRCCDTGR